MIKQLLAISFLLLVGKTLAQPSIFTFEDYTKCYVGFLTNKKDTLWPAQFESALVARDYNRYVNFDTWIVKFNGRYGLLTKNGDIALPFEYEEINVGIEIDSYIVRKNGKVGIIRENGKVLIDFAYDRIEIGYLNEQIQYYLPYIAEKKGIITKDYRQLAATNYEEVELIYGYNYGYDDAYYSSINDIPYFWQLSDSINSGLIDQEGKLIFPLEYDYIERYYLRSRCGKVQHYWGLYNSEGKQGLARVDGELLIPVAYDHVSIYQTQEINCEDSILSFVHSEDNKEKSAFNLKTGEKSNFYGYLKNQGKYHVFNKKGTFGILDEHMKAIPINTKLEISLFSQGHFVREEYTHNEDDRWYDGEMVLDNQVVVISKIGEYVRSNQSAKSRKQKENLFGLYNYKTKEYLKPKHHLMYRKTFQDQSYFWGITFTDTEHEIGNLSIYSADLKVIQSYDFQDLNHNSIEIYMACAASSEKIFLFKSKNQLIGGINAKGDLLLPFEYTKAAAIRESEYDDCFNYSIILEKDGKKGICDSKGKLILALEYDEVSYDYSSFLKLRNANKYTLLDSNLNVLISNCSELFISSSDGLMKQKLDNITNRNILGESIYFAIQENQLFALQGKKFVKMDEQFVLIQNPFGVIGYRVLVNSKGNVIAYGDRVLKVLDKLYAVQKNTNLKIYNFDAELLNDLQDISYFKQGNSWLEVKSTKNRWGVVDFQTGKTLIEPRYGVIYSFYNDRNLRDEPIFWVSDQLVQGGVKGEWKLMNAKGEQLIPLLFDYPFYFNDKTSEVVHSNYKMGLIDSALKLLVPIEFTSIIALDQSHFLKKNGAWWAFQKGELKELKCNIISADTYPKGRLVFTYNQVGVLGKDLEWTLPLTDIEIVKQQVNLSELLGVKSYDAIKGKMNNSFIKDTSDIARRINNIHLIELGKLHSTQFNFLEKTSVIYGSKPHVLERIPELRQLDLNVVYFSNAFFSVIRKSSYMSWDRFVLNNYSINWEAHKRECASYKIQDTSFVKIELADLFLPGADYIQNIDDKLTRIINKKQLYGTNCVNLVQILKDYKLNFFLHPKGIYFCQPNTENNQILIEYKELVGLKNMNP